MSRLPRSRHACSRFDDKQQLMPLALYNGRAMGHHGSSDPKWRQYETVGKTELLLHWSQQSGLPTTYWTAEKEPAALQLSIVL